MAGVLGRSIAARVNADGICRENPPALARGVTPPASRPGARCSKLDPLQAALDDHMGSVPVASAFGPFLGLYGGLMARFGVGAG